MPEPTIIQEYPAFVDDTTVVSEQLAEPVIAPVEYVRLTLTKMRSITRRTESLADRASKTLEDYSDCGLVPSAEARGIRGMFVDASSKLYEAEDLLRQAVELARDATQQLEDL